ncbi:hypothetical protein JYT71_00185 [Acidimicrobiaceae bacterium AH-315-P05]|nr:hypothetical protein [Acidimicrobiaceae bacterium AH-315-P05]
MLGGIVAQPVPMQADGARLWNAAVASRVPPSEIAHGFNSVTICLSKGLGAPAGAVLAGSTELVEEARRCRKILGGDLHQAEMLAAAGPYAIDHHLERLSIDHENALILPPGCRTTARLPSQHRTRTWSSLMSIPAFSPISRSVSPTMESTAPSTSKCGSSPTSAFPVPTSTSPSTPSGRSWDH